MDPGRRRLSSLSAASAASPPRPGRTPGPRPRCAAPPPTRTPSPATDGTDALPEQLAAQARDRAQSTALASAHAERWVRTIRSECRDRCLILGSRHLDHLLRVYREHYNRHRPHRSLALRPPERARLSAIEPARAGARVRRRDLLGGLIHEYELAA